MGTAPKAAIDSEPKERPRTGDELKALCAGLDHARTLVIASHDVRMRNFNFFVLITAALMTGYTRQSWGWLVVLDLAGIVSSLSFFALDIRGAGIHKRAGDLVRSLEPIVWESASVPRVDAHAGEWRISVSDPPLDL